MPNPRRAFVSALLLAAGSSTRFGSPKQLARLDGITFVKRALTTLQDSDVDEVVVVLGHKAEEVEREVEGRDARIVVNTGFSKGLASSLKVGVSALDKRSEAVVVCLVDQPFVTAALINEIVARFRDGGSNAVASSAGGTISPPVLLGRIFFDDIKSLSGDAGAKGIVMRHPGFQRVEADELVLRDLDTVDALEKARAATSALPGGKEKARAEDAP